MATGTATGHGHSTGRRRPRRGPSPTTRTTASTAARCGRPRTGRAATPASTAPRAASTSDEGPHRRGRAARGSARCQLRPGHPLLRRGPRQAPRALAAPRWRRAADGERIHRFVRLLGIRRCAISTSEVLDAMRCAREPGVLARPRDAPGRPARRAGQGPPRRGGRSTRSSTSSSPWCRSAPRTRARPRARARGPLRRGRAGELHPLRGPRATPRSRATRTARPSTSSEFFDPEDLAQQYNLHQEANKIDLAAMTDEIVFSKDEPGTSRRGQPGADRDRPPARRRAARADLASRRARRWTPTSRSPSRRRCSGG